MKKLKYLLVIILTLIVGVIILLALDYYSVLAFGFYNRQYVYMIGDNTTSFIYRKNLIVMSDLGGTMLEITKPQYVKFFEDRPLVSININENVRSEETGKLFDNVREWYDNFTYGTLEGRNIQEVNWLDQKALLDKQTIDNNTIKKIISTYVAFDPAKKYVIEMIYESPTKFNGELDKEFKQILNSYKFLNK